MSVMFVVKGIESSCCWSKVGLWRHRWERWSACWCWNTSCWQLSAAADSLSGHLSRCTGPIHCVISTFYSYFVLSHSVKSCSIHVL